MTAFMRWVAKQLSQVIYTIICGMSFSEKERQYAAVMLPEIIDANHWRFLCSMDGASVERRWYEDRLRQLVPAAETHLREAKLPTWRRNAIEWLVLLSRTTWHGGAGSEWSSGYFRALRYGLRKWRRHRPLTLNDYGEYAA